VHGDKVIEVLESEGGDTSRVPPPVAEADGVWSQQAGTAVGVKTADCLPILLCDPKGRRVAAVHAGWRGTVSRIVERALEQLFAAGTRPRDVLAAVGPAIQSCCYEVGDDLAARFEQEFGKSVVVPGAKPHLALNLAVHQSLIKLGVPEAQIELRGECTSCDSRFYSHRRDKGVTGRHLSFIAHRF
jgi:YfiH family protein